MSKQKTTGEEAQAETPVKAAKEISAKEIVMRVLGVGEFGAEGVLKRLGDKAKDLPAAYAGGTARDFLATYNVKSEAKESQ